MMEGLKALQKERDHWFPIVADRLAVVTEPFSDFTPVSAAIVINECRKLTEKET